MRRRGGCCKNARTRPTAILAGNDTIALGAIAAIADAGLSVPEDVAVVGFDNLPTAPFMQPPLTTIDNPAREQGVLGRGDACAAAAARADREARIRVPVKLVVRRSCGAALAP